MKEFDPVAYKKKVKSYQDRDDPTGWFDSIYASRRQRRQGSGPRGLS